MRGEEEKFDFPIGDGNDVRVVIYVPTTRYDEPISTKEVEKKVDETVDFLSKSFGGTTRVDGVGMWLDNKGRRIKEEVIKITSFAPHKSYLRQDLQVKRFLLEAKRKWKQYSLAYEFESPERKNSRLYFI